MNYSRIYEHLIQRARNRVPEGYVERHHIVPRCMGGSDENANLVALTPEEHFTAHVLLVKMYPEQSGLIVAVNKMCRGRGRSRNKMYGWLKRRFAEEQSRAQSGSGNSQHGTRWVNDGTLSKKISCDDPIPDGFILGRVKKLKTPNPEKACPSCGELTRKRTQFCSRRCARKSQAPISEESRKKISMANRGRKYDASAYASRSGPDWSNKMKGRRQVAG